MPWPPSSRAGSMPRKASEVDDLEAKIRQDAIVYPLSYDPYWHIIVRMSDPHPIAVVEDTAVPIPANARALFAKMAAFNDAKRTAEVGELQTVHEMCLAYRRSF